MKGRLIFYMFFYACVSVQAQRVYTLDDCRTLALRNNLSVQTARLEVEGAKETRREAFTKYFPMVNGTATGFKSDKGALGVSVLNGLFSTSFVDRGVLAGVTAVQPVFAGGQIVNGNKLAKLNVSVKNEQLRQSENDAVLNAEQYYWQIVTLKEKAKTLGLVAEQVDTIYRDVKTAVDAGVAMRNDLLQVELQRNKISSGLLKVDNGLKVVKMLLAQCLEVSADSFEIASVDLEKFPNPEDLRVEHQTALLNTVSYRLLQKNVEANRIQRNMEIGKRLPTVGIGAGYMYYNLPGRHEWNVFEDTRSMGMVFASVIVPISDWWGGTHAVRQRNVQLKIAEYTKQSNGELILVQMQQLWNELVEAYKQVEIARQSVAKAMENMRISTDSYHAGTMTLSDWLSAQSLLQQSRDLYVEEATGYLMKRTRYLQATGRDIIR